MAYIEIKISDSKLMKMIQENSNESYDSDFNNKLMKLALKIVNEWGCETLDVSTLKRMKKMSTEALSDLGEI